MTGAVLIVAYVVPLFPAAVLLGRWADREEITDPFLFGVVFAFVWPVCAVLAVLILAARGLASAAEATSRRWSR